MKKRILMLNYESKNRKAYKLIYANHNNIPPGDLQRLPDDCFFSFKNLIGGKLANG